MASGFLLEAGVEVVIILD